jgi:hypothetical protein
MIEMKSGRRSGTEVSTGVEAHQASAVWPGVQTRDAHECLVRPVAGVSELAHGSYAR